jgi:tRNA-Thr(GGU) m(6)t(6)A37 methyltransferase TsaA
MNLKTIATIQSCYKEKFGTPRQGLLVPESLGILKFKDEFRDPSFIEDLKYFSHIWIIAGFHLSEKNSNSKIRAPKYEGMKLSVFATRSPHRPNPLSLSLVKIEKISPGELIVSGIDLIEGTPVYDIKPYIPEYDICELATSKLLANDNTFNVQFSEKALSDLVDILIKNSASLPTEVFELNGVENYDGNHSLNLIDNILDPDLKMNVQQLSLDRLRICIHLQKLITNTVLQDPRPIPYLQGYEDRIYGLSIYNLNIKFCYLSDNIEIVSIELLP